MECLYRDVLWEGERVWSGFTEMPCGRVSVYGVSLQRCLVGG